MVWAEACEVGCAIVNCPSLSDLYYYHFLYNPFSDDDNGANPATAYVMVCVYGPSFPSDIYNRPPYVHGTACSQCPNQFSECEENSYYPPRQYVLQHYLQYRHQQATGAGLEDVNLGGLCCKWLYYSNSNLEQVVNLCSCMNNQKRLFPTYNKQLY